MCPNVSPRVRLCHQKRRHVSEVQHHQKYLQTDISNMLVDWLILRFVLNVKFRWTVFLLVDSDCINLLVTDNGCHQSAISISTNLAR